jgi:hypothetical protein
MNSAQAACEHARITSTPTSRTINTPRAKAGGNPMTSTSAPEASDVRVVLAAACPECSRAAGAAACPPCAAQVELIIAVTKLERMFVTALH